MILAGGRFSVRFFDLAGPAGPTNLIRPLGGKLNSLDWSPSSDKIAIASHDSTVYIWSDDLRNPKMLEAVTHSAVKVKWSPDGQHLAAADGNANVRVASADGTVVRELSGDGGYPTSLSWSPDGQRLAIAKRFSESVVLDMEGNQVSIAFHDGGVGGVSLSPDGKLLATAGLDAKVRISRIDKMAVAPQEVAVLEALDGDVDSIDWSPDGKWLASGHNTSVRLWHPDGKPGPVIPAASAAIMSVDWSPDSQSLVTGSWDTRVRLWNLNGDLRREFPGHAAPCMGTSFSPDGIKLATCGWDSVARILDVKTGEILAMTIQVADPVLDGPRYPIHHAISFNRAGQVMSGDPKILEQQVVYLVEKPTGAFSLLTPSEFQARAPGAILAERPTGK